MTRTPDALRSDAASRLGDAIAAYEVTADRFYAAGDNRLGNLHHDRAVRLRPLKEILGSLNPCSPERGDG
jgi:hypothetical protein